MFFLQKLNLQYIFKTNANNFKQTEAFVYTLKRGSLSHYFYPVCKHACIKCTVDEGYITWPFRPYSGEALRTIRKLTIVKEGFKFKHLRDNGRSFEAPVCSESGRGTGLVVSVGGPRLRRSIGCGFEPQSRKKLN